MEISNMLRETVEYVLGRTNQQAKVGIVLGTGLSALLDHAEVITSLPYSHIPHFPISTTPTHLGRLVLARLNGVMTWILAGRVHYYEGYSMAQITYPIRVLAAMGVETLFVTNASGSINENIYSSDIVAIEDHINMLPDNPLRGFLDDRMGNRFVELIGAYDQDILSTLFKAAEEKDIDLKKGIYIAVQGPSLETMAEYKFYHQIGGDVIGMSSVPEVIVARQKGLRVGMISVVSNQGYPHTESATLDQIVENVKHSIPNVVELIKTAMQHL